VGRLFPFPGRELHPLKAPGLSWRTEEHPYAFAPNYNITPESFQPVVRLSHETGEREFAQMKWGLVPYWSKAPKATFSSINARADNLETSGAWREPFKRRRCHPRRVLLRVGTEAT
jgi:putative SOS response-associated peptidase YedK